MIVQLINAIFGALICYHLMGSYGKFRDKVSLISNMSCLAQPCRIIGETKTIDNASWSNTIFSSGDKNRNIRIAEPPRSSLSGLTAPHFLHRTYRDQKHGFGDNRHATSTRGTSSSAALARNSTNLARIIRYRRQTTDRRQNARVGIYCYTYRLPMGHIVSCMSNMIPQTAKKLMRIL